MFVLVATCLFPWITSCLTRCFLLQNAKALAISTSSHRGGCRPCFTIPTLSSPSLECVKHCQNFSFVFSAPLPAWRNLFSASGIFCGGRYQPSGIFRPAEGTSQPVTISKKWKNPSSPSHRSTGPSVNWDVCPRNRSKITEGPVLRPFSYT
jgi:hypothetical protein